MDKGFDVVTGGAGFIGSHICRGLLARGRRVRIIDNLSTGREENLQDLYGRFGDSCEFVHQDICDESALTKLLEGAQDVFHHAALPSVQRSVEDPLTSDKVNVCGTLTVLLAARKSCVRKVVYASSSSLYGDSLVLPKHERMMPRLLSPYAISKYAGELYCRVFTELYGLPTLALRYFNVFGPFQNPESEYAAVIPRFVARMLEGEQPIIYGDGKQSRDFTYVENVVEANLRAAESESQGLCLNVACGARHSLNQIVQMLNDLLGTRLDPRYESARVGDVSHSEADISLAQQIIGYVPSVGFKEGLKRTVEWYRMVGSS